MHGKQGRYCGTAARITGGPLQYPEQQHHVKHMEQQVDLMVPRRVETKQLHVQSVREPRHRMPVQRVKSGECPLHGVPVQTAFDVDVVGDVLVVVQIEEGMMTYGEVQSDSRGREKKLRTRFRLFRVKRFAWLASRGLLASFD